MIVTFRGDLPCTACLQYFTNISLTPYPVTIFRIRKMTLQKIMQLTSPVAATKR